MCNIISKVCVFPELPHPPHWCPDDGLHTGDDQHREGGVKCQALFQLQCLQGAAFWPGRRHGLLDQQGKNQTWVVMFDMCAFFYLCWPTVSLSRQVNAKMREIMEKELKMKQHFLESPSHQKVTACVSLCFTPLSHTRFVCHFVTPSHCFRKKSFLSVVSFFSDFVAFVNCLSGWDFTHTSFPHWMQ